MLEKDGLVKLVEECGELIQVAAKKMTRMDTDEHWDGAGLLSERMQSEMGDVIAAIRIVSYNFDLDLQAIDRRAIEKFDLFSQWMDEDAEAADVGELPCATCGGFKNIADGCFGSKPCPACNTASPLYRMS